MIIYFGNLSGEMHLHVFFFHLCVRHVFRIRSRRLLTITVLATVCQLPVSRLINLLAISGTFGEGVGAPMRGKDWCFLFLLRRV